MRKILVWLLITAALGATWLGSGGAWDGHDLITQRSLAGWSDLAWPVRETPVIYDDWDPSEYNPAFEVKFYHANEDWITVRDVLVTYAPEPDWDLDTELDLSPWQALTGGSQGWRHQRYLLFGSFIRLGVAPDRAQHFYDLALRAYEERDLYWAFRFLARSLHYLQDMGQPYHSLPFPAMDIVTEHVFNLTKATTVATNAHYNLEAYVEWRLLQGYEPFLEAIQGNDAQPITTVAEAAAELNEEVRQFAERQYELTMRVWPDLAIPVRQTLDFDQDPVRTGRYLDDLHSIIEHTLALTGSYTRGLLLKFQTDTGMPLGL